MNPIQKYFINPIVEGTGYNMINTSVYAIIFVCFVYVVFILLKKAKIEIKKFLITFVPFIIMGGVVRALTDYKIFLHDVFSTFPGYYFAVTPGIYLFMFLLTIFTIICGKLLAPLMKKPWEYISVTIGSLMLLFAISKLKIVLWKEFLIIWLLTCLSTGLFYIIAKMAKKPDYFKTENVIMVFGHMLDASATFIGVDYLGFYEQHVLPRFFFELTGTAAALFVLKFIVLIPAIYYLESEKDDDDFIFFIKIVVFVLGFGPGLRDVLTIGMFSP